MCLAFVYVEAGFSQFGHIYPLPSTLDNTVYNKIWYDNTIRYVLVHYTNIEEDNIVIYQLITAAIITFSKRNVRLLSKGGYYTRSATKHL